MAGTRPLSGSFSLVYPGHTFQEPTRTPEMSVFSSASTLASELAKLETIGNVRVSRTDPTAEGELSWTVTFLSGEGDVPVLQPVVDGIIGKDASVRVSTLTNGVAPVGGSFSLVAYGIPGEVRNRTGFLLILYRPF